MEDIQKWSVGREKMWLLRLGAFLVLMVSLYYLGLMIKGFQDLSERHAFAITATGEGTVYVVPDIATLSLTVRSEGVNLANVQDDNTAKNNKVVAFLKSKGVDQKDIQTSYYNVTPQYQYGNQVCPLGYPCPPSGPPKIASYEVTNSLAVKVRDLNSIGDILAGAVNAGANDINGPSFTVDDPSKTEADAKKIAIDKARENAERLAGQLGVRIVRITGFSESGGAMPIYARETLMDAKGGVAAAPAPSIEPGQNEVKITVSVTYEAR
jgi:uncharacterized protein YggE